MGGGDTSSYQIERLTTYQALVDLQGPWTELARQGASATIFQTWEWANTWWQHRAAGWELWLLAARDRHGSLAGLVPWMSAAQRSGPVQLRRISFLGSRFAPPVHGDVITRPGAAAGVAEAALRYVRDHRGEWDVLDLEGLADGSALDDCVAAAGGHLVEREPQPNPYVDLPLSWEAYERQYLSGNRRQQVRSKQRRLERDHPGQVVFHRVGDRAELPAAIDALVSLNQARWHAQGLLASWDDEQFQAVVREFAGLALDRGWLRLHQLLVAGQTIATELCFLYNRVWVNFQRGFDLAWDQYSPGQVLYGYVIREAIAEGAREFDMLTGAHPYKLSWTDQVRPELHPVLSGSWRGDTWLLRGMAFDAAQTAARKVLSPAVRQRINRLAAARG